MLKSNDHEELQQLQFDCGVSNKGAARLLGISLNTYKNIVYGKVRVPEKILIQFRQLKKAIDIIF